MAPLVMLVIVSAGMACAGLLGCGYARPWPTPVAVGLAAMFLMTGVSHFVPRRRAGLVAVVPPGLPRPELLVTLTGVAEVVGAVGLLVPSSIGPWRSIAAGCLALLLVLVFPANVHAARAKMPAPAPSTPLVRRTIVQLVYLGASLLVAGA